MCVFEWSWERVRLVSPRPPPLQISFINPRPSSFLPLGAATSFQRRPGNADVSSAHGLHLYTFHSSVSGHPHFCRRVPPSLFGTVLGTRASHFFGYSFE